MSTVITQRWDSITPAQYDQIHAIAGTQMFQRE
jgi:hypothetical protein